MADVVYRVDYPDPSYIQEASNDSRREIRAEPMSRCSCFVKANLFLVRPWSNHIDWWYRCKKCGKIMYAYDCKDEDNDSALKHLMEKAGFKFNEKNFLDHVEKFLRKITK